MPLTPEQVHWLRQMASVTLDGPFMMLFIDALSQDEFNNLVSSRLIRLPEFERLFPEQMRQFQLNPDAFVLVPEDHLAELPVELRLDIADRLRPVDLAALSLASTSDRALLRAPGRRSARILARFDNTQHLWTSNGLDSFLQQPDIAARPAEDALTAAMMQFVHDLDHDLAGLTDAQEALFIHAAVHPQDEQEANATLIGGAPTLSPGGREALIRGILARQDAAIRLRQLNLYNALLPLVGDDLQAEAFAAILDARGQASFGRNLDGVARQLPLVPEPGRTEIVETTLALPVADDADTEVEGDNARIRAQTLGAVGRNVRVLSREDETGQPHRVASALVELDDDVAGMGIGGCGEGLADFDGGEIQRLLNRTVTLADEALADAIEGWVQVWPTLAEDQRGMIARTIDRLQSGDLVRAVDALAPVVTDEPGALRLLFEHALRCRGADVIEDDHLAMIVARLAAHLDPEADPDLLRDLLAATDGFLPPGPRSGSATPTPAMPTAMAVDEDGPADDDTDDDTVMGGDDPDVEMQSNDDDTRIEAEQRYGRAIGGFGRILGRLGRDTRRDLIGSAGDAGAGAPRALRGLSEGLPGWLAGDKDEEASAADREDAAMFIDAILESSASDYAEVASRVEHNGREVLPFDLYRRLLLGPVTVQLDRLDEAVRRGLDRMAQRSLDAQARPGSSAAGAAQSDQLQAIDRLRQAYRAHYALALHRLVNGATPPPPALDLMLQIVDALRGMAASPREAELIDLMEYWVRNAL